MNQTSEYYKDKVAVVTGGASGIGLALAETMLSFGAKQVVLADFNDENLNREAVRLNSAYPGKVAGIHCNVTKEEDVQGMILKVAEFGGRIDILFNNAGAGLGGPFDKQTNAARTPLPISRYIAVETMRILLRLGEASCLPFESGRRRGAQRLSPNG